MENDNVFTKERSVDQTPQTTTGWVRNTKKHDASSSLHRRGVAWRDIRMWEKNVFKSKRQFIAIHHNPQRLLLGFTMTLGFTMMLGSPP